MRQFTGTKTVNAQPMTRAAYNLLRGWSVPENENPADIGYLVEYTDGGPPNHPEFKGYISWSPAEVFENAYAPSGSHIERMNNERDELDRKISALNAFTGSEPFHKLEYRQQALMQMQLSTMQTYRQILAARISNDLGTFS